MSNNEKLEAKIDVLDTKVDQINVHLAVYNAHLGEHIRRTANLEVRAEKLEEKTSGYSRFQERVIGAIKLMGASGIGAAIIKLFS